MAIYFLSLQTYQQKNRIIVQYYDSGKESELICPDCSNKVEFAEDQPNSHACMEIHCPQCTTALAMVSSKLPNNWLENRCI